eukprot:3938783-Rhodomonas_salina.1
MCSTKPVTSVPRHRIPGTKRAVAVPHITCMVPHVLCPYRTSHTQYQTWHLARAGTKHGIPVYHHVL